MARPIIINNRRLYGGLFDLRDYQAKELIDAGGGFLEVSHVGRKKVSAEKIKELIFEFKNAKFYKSKKPFWTNPVSGLSGYKLYQIQWEKINEDSDSKGND